MPLIRYAYIYIYIKCITKILWKISFFQSEKIDLRLNGISQQEKKGGGELVVWGIVFHHWKTTSEIWHPLKSQFTSRGREQTWFQLSPLDEFCCRVRFFSQQNVCLFVGGATCSCLGHTSYIISDWWRKFRAKNSWYFCPWPVSMCLILPCP